MNIIQIFLYPLLGFACFCLGWYMKEDRYSKIQKSDNVPQQKIRNEKQ